MKSLTLQRITLEAAEAEPESDRLFGPSYDARQRALKAREAFTGVDRAVFRPWDKPIVQRAKSTTRGA